MKKIYLFVFALFLAPACLFSQDYYHAVGGGIAVGVYKLNYNLSSDNGMGGTNIQPYSESSFTYVPGIMYKATMIFMDEGPNIGVSAYPFLGFSLQANSQVGSTGAFGLELPINGEVYFGDPDDSCFFLGAGYTYGTFKQTDFVYESSGKVIGPNFGVGGQFYRGDNLIGIRLAYTVGLNSANINDADVEITRDKKSLFTGSLFYSLSY